MPTGDRPRPAAEASAATRTPRPPVPGEPRPEPAARTRRHRTRPREPPPTAPPPSTRRRAARGRPATTKPPPSAPPNPHRRGRRHRAGHGRAVATEPSQPSPSPPSQRRRTGASRRRLADAASGRTPRAPPSTTARRSPAAGSRPPQPHPAAGQRPGVPPAAPPSPPTPAAVAAIARPPVPAPPRPAVPGPPGAPRPAATHVADSPAPHPSPVAAASTEPARWGRVDADGTIYLRTADGERAVGSWQAGAPEEGLAHFARRFDDLLTEVELLAARLAAGGGEPKHALNSARTLRDGLADATVVGDVVGLRAWLDALVTQAEEAVGAARSARDATRAAAIARKEELATEVESLAAEATQWKQAGDRFKVILDEWRTIRGIDRKTDELLWKRFSKAREAFNRRRGSHFADLDRQRAGAKARKEELAVEAEKLADSDDWGPTAARFRDLMTEWKAAGRAQKDADDALWQRFRTAQDAFFARRTATFAERDAEFVANAAAKKALLAEAEKIDTSDPSAARAALRQLQERWEAIGKVPRDDIRPLEARLRAVEERVRESADRQWRRTDPEAEARVAQFRDRVAQFEAQAEKARAAGDSRRAEQAQAQAQQWREWLATAEQAVQQR